MDGLQVSYPVAGGGRPDHRPGAPPSRWQARLARKSRLITFSALVILPTIATGVYFSAFAARQYVSEAKFVVRGPASQSVGMLSGFLQTAGLSRAEDDAHAVQDFILSRDALGGLATVGQIRDVFARPEADRLARFPGVFGGATFEHLYKFYQKHVDVMLDSGSGVSTLTVKTFRAEDSQAVAQSLLRAAEDLVNRINARQHDDALRDAHKEVSLAETRVEAVAADVAEFRNRESLLDPNKQSVPMLQGITELQTMLSRVNLQITQLTSASPNNPLIADYRRRASALQAQIDTSNKKITGSGESLVPKITAYDLLNLQREFADKELASATSSLEAARIQAQRQQLYLETIVQPNFADYAAYPKGATSTAVVFASLLGLYGMGFLLIAGAREHQIV